MNSHTTGLILGGVLAFLAGNAVTAEPDPFRVCADPNSLPFSNEKGAGLENRLAEIWAAELGRSVEYTWFPQRRGFLRNTLLAVDPKTGSYKCDVVMGVPHGYERLITTKPYYHSTYALVYVTGRQLDDVKSGADFANLAEERKSKLKVGAFVPTPATVWISRIGMTKQLVAFPAMSGDPGAYPGELVEKELVQGKIDAAVVWGPIAGYFAKQAKDAALKVIPLPSEAGIKFDFAISAGVRFGQGDAKQEIETAMEKTADKMKAVLDEYQVPLVTSDGDLL